MKRADPAQRFGREELEALQAEVETSHDIPGVGHTGRNGIPLASAARLSGAVSPGDDKLCSRFNAALEIRSLRTVPTPTTAPSTSAILRLRPGRRASGGSLPEPSVRLRPMLRRSDAPTRHRRSRAPGSPGNPHDLVDAVHRPSSSTRGRPPFRGCASVLFRSSVSPIDHTSHAIQV